MDHKDGQICEAIWILNTGQVNLWVEVLWTAKMGKYVVFCGPPRQETIQR